MSLSNFTCDRTMDVALTAIELLSERIKYWALFCFALDECPELIIYEQYYSYVDEKHLDKIKDATSKRARFLRKYAGRLNFWLMHYEYLYKRNLPLPNNLIRTARFLEQDLIVDLFDEDVKRIDEYLETALSTSLHLIYSLCELVIMNKVDLKNNFKDGGSFFRVFEGDWDIYLDHQNKDYRMMAQLMQAAVELYYDAYDDHIFTDEWYK